MQSLQPAGEKRIRTLFHVWFQVLTTYLSLKCFVKLHVRKVWSLLAWVLVGIVFLGNVLFKTCPEWIDLVTVHALVFPLTHIDPVSQGRVGDVQEVGSLLGSNLFHFLQRLNFELI